MVYKIEEAVQSQTVTVVLSMGKYVLIMVFLAHMEACSWYGLATRDPSIPPGNELGDDAYPVTWVQRQEMLEPAFAAERDKEIPWGRYIASLYWAFTTMSTVGYGDIYPVNETERVFAIASMVVACCCFAMVVGGLQQVLAKFGQERQEFDRMLLKTMRYLRSQRVNRELQYKVKRYLEHNFDNKSQTSMDPKLMENLSDNLKSEVMVALLLPIMEQFPLFKQSSRLFLVRMCTGTQTHRHAPGDVVADPGTVASSMYFVVTGRLVMIKVGRSNETPSQYYEGYWIGELNLFISETRAYTILSVSFSEVLEISRSALQQTLQDFPKMLSTYKEMKDRIKEGDRSAVEFLCVACGMPGHADGACQSKEVSLQPKLPWYSRWRKNKLQRFDTAKSNRSSLARSDSALSQVPVADDGGK
jgi:cyclic nucleotide gated channel alpha 3